MAGLHCRYDSSCKRLRVDFTQSVHLSSETDFDAIIQSGMDAFELVQKQIRLNPKDVETLCELSPGVLSIQNNDSVIKLRNIGGRSFV